MSLIHDFIRNLSAYTPPLEGRDPEVQLLLNFNERTIPPHRRIIDGLCDYLKSGKLGIYPSYGTICERVAEYAGVKSSEVMLSNGSDQGIELLVRSLCSKGDSVVIPRPGFAMYSQVVATQGALAKYISYSREGGFPFDDARQLAIDGAKIIFVPNPNNPTGTPADPASVDRLLKEFPNTAIIVDECYFEYTGVTLAPKVALNNNLFVLRTFSKTWGLASLRIGYLIASAANITDLLKVRGPYDVNGLAVKALEIALDDPGYVKDYVAEVRQKSKPLLEEFLKQKNIPFWPSVANYLLVDFDDSEKVVKELALRGILVRPRKDESGKVSVRISIGTEEQIKTLISALEEIL